MHWSLWRPLFLGLCWWRSLRQRRPIGSKQLTLRKLFPCSWKSSPTPTNTRFFTKFCNFCLMFFLTLFGCESLNLCWFWVGGVLGVWYHVAGEMWWVCVKLLWIYGVLMWILLLFYFIFYGLGWWGFATLVSHSGTIEMKHDKLIWFHEVSQ